MNCTKCGAPEVIIIKKHSGQKLCQDCFVQGIERKVLKDIRKYKLIEKGDKVLVALSGGKDSVMLLDILNSLYERGIINMVAVTIDEGIKGYREDGVKIAKNHAKSLGIEHRIVTFDEYFDLTLDKIMDGSSQRKACTYCGVFRRWILNKVALEMGATKIATGHNLDDETQAILMNYLEGNIENLAKIGPKTRSKSDKFTVKIKPLREIPEKEIGLYVVAKNLEVHFAGCPYSEESFRGEVGQILKNLSRKHPTIMYSTLRGFDKIRPVIKKEFQKEFGVGECTNCGEPAANELCRACIFLRELEK
ncbi:TIGR00269 family protein [Methanobacterium alcaliphilum]|uniref:TIGR00269 family protein n=1 Tax=Methanobacterium alcaliphilum TaxID=392018 RepID=UPI00200B2C31|nr:TIGR00269 family protein [Methanobacterium alcaliphilum]MCK9152146.1 TIGR00269 family protein [Methanobacterium alcaliphilum]